MSLTYPDACDTVRAAGLTPSQNEALTIACARRLEAKDAEIERLALEVQRGIAEQLRLARKVAHLRALMRAAR
jgi:hypothetical protein